MENNNAKFLNNVKLEECFYLKNGRVLKNLYELTNSLASMDEETFKDHVNNERNDFANWIRYVLKDEKLANKISRLKNRDSILKQINKRLSNASKKKKKKDEKSQHLDEVKKQKNQKEETAKMAVLKWDKGESKEKTGSDKHHEEAIRDKEESKEKTGSDKHHEEVIKKLDEILLKEKELNKREQKIQEIEERIEKKMEKEKQTYHKEEKFFSKEFIQGLVTGLLITFILSLIYIKFYY